MFSTSYLSQALSAALQQTQDLFIHADRIKNWVYVDSGGYGDVFKAELKQRGSHVTIAVAVKVVKERSRTRTTNVETLLEALFREIIPWARLDHPNVVPFLGYSFDGRLASLVSPWYENGNVKSYLKSHPNLDRRKVILETARGLEYLHKQTPSIIHADLKAANIIIDDQGAARLCDFGLARFAASGPSGFSNSDGFHGTTRWASPEVLLDSPNTTASDVWSFGCVVGEVLSSKIPLGDIRADVAVSSMLIGEKFSADALYPEIPQTHPLRPILNKCWAKYAHDRLSITEICALIEGIPRDDWSNGLPPTIDAEEMHSGYRLIRNESTDNVDDPNLRRFELHGDLVQQEEVARGALSDIYLGLWTAPGASAPRKVAIKYFLSLPRESRRRRTRHLFREVIPWKELQHPFVQPLLGFITKPRPCVISPWCEHRDLLTYLGAHPDADKLLLVYQVVQGVTYLHNHHPIVIHGNLKPANILINDLGQAVIADFGLSEIKQKLQSGLTTSGNYGEPRYMAPELFQDGKLSTASDVYAFSILSIEILSGIKPFSQRWRSRVILDVMTGRRPLQPEHPFPDSLRLWPLFARCWVSDPELRPPIEEAREGLRRCILSRGSWHWMDKLDHPAHGVGTSDIELPETPKSMAMSIGWNSDSSSESGVELYSTPENTLIGLPPLSSDSE